MYKTNLVSPCFYGVGVGPGDPELITLKAARIIESAHVVCFLVNEQGDSQARNIAQDHLKNGQIELPIYMPMKVNPEIGSAVYDAAALSIKEHLKNNRNVVFLCEGDPLFFGSFAYLLLPIQGEYKCEAIPGIASPHGASARLLKPLTMLKESYAVISGRHSEDQIRLTLNSQDSVVIMKAGRARPKILKLLKECNRLQEANYLEYIGRDNELIIEDVSTLANEVGPYFSLFVILRLKRGRS
jgi:precorrin-2/cobalt-factor-2 C20-methyltransferase